MLAAEPGEYDDDNAAYVDADRDPAPALVVRRNDQRVVKKRFIQISEIQPVLVEVGETLWLVPNDFHNYYVSTICGVVNYIVDTR
jgi:hypothetical protein